MGFLLTFPPFEEIFREECCTWSEGKMKTFASSCGHLLFSVLLSVVFSSVLNQSALTTGHKCKFVGWWRPINVFLCSYTHIQTMTNTICHSMRVLSWRKLCEGGMFWEGGYVCVWVREKMCVCVSAFFPHPSLRVRPVIWSACWNWGSVTAL